MIINICDRCGAPLPPIARGEEPQDGRIRVNGAELCGECRHTQDIEHAVNGGFTVEEENGTLVVPDNVQIFRQDDGNIILIEEEGK